MLPVVSASRGGVFTMLLGFAAALAYCSWPLGYLVNPSLAATALASELEARGQAYGWLFVLLDCATGIMVALVVQKLWSHGCVENDRLIRVALIAYVIFGVSTAIDALVPVSCGTVALRACGANLSNLNWDDFLTGLADLALFVAAICAQFWAVRKLSWNPILLITFLAIVIWSCCGLAFFADHFSVSPNVTWQHLLLTLSSVVIFVIPLTITLARRRIGVRPLTSEVG